MLIGHQKIMQYLQNAAASGNLAHAYTFVGQDQVGKRTLARIFAAQLLGVEENKLDSHPDFFYLARIEDEKTGKLKKDLSVAQARDLRARLQSRSWLGGYRVTIIDEAELLNEESGNALLKVLEEPAEKSILLLLAENESAILPTIRSRAPAVYFSLISKKEIVAELVNRGISAVEAESAAELSWGRPGKAIELANDAELRGEHLHEIERWKKIINQPFYSKLKIIEDIFGSKDDAIRGRERLGGILDVWIMEFRKLLLEKTSQHFNSKQLQEIIDGLGEAKKFLKQNVHPRLLIEQAILKY